MMQFTPTPARLLFVILASLGLLLIGAWLETFPLQTLSSLAPLATAIIALIAAIIALSAMFLQRDTAKRRAAIDFFLKTEMDDKIIETYKKFNLMTAAIPQIIGRRDLKRTDQDYCDLRNWLNICELIAVGVNLGAFSERVSRDYWGYVLPDSFREAHDFIMHIRRVPGLGGKDTLCELEKLCIRWNE